MAVDERARHELHSRLDEVLGPDVTTTLMGLLPPVGWADVATRRDLDALEARLTSRFEASLHRELGGLRSELNQQTRTLFFSLTGVLLTLAGLALAAIRFA
ncbi:hypothetical protein [Nitriliruptor alkaliphilus]|uniref:hypothetical protein n=1 Tax=Nitriliruptor alkaliphilus TaxID=427918 RepID=UPI000695EE97|nr:hypothetical protein [Nitriliruptor alkaliphilus]